MSKFLIILKPDDKSYRTEKKPLPGGIYEAKTGEEAMKKALDKFGKPADVMWAEEKKEKGKGEAMSWFRKKKGYWYFVESKHGKEIQHYIGNDEAIKRKLLPKKKAKDLRAMETTRSKR